MGLLSHTQEVSRRYANRLPQFDNWVLGIIKGIESPLNKMRVASVLERFRDDTRSRLTESAIRADLPNSANSADYPKSVFGSRSGGESPARIVRRVPYKL